MSARVAIICDQCGDLGTVASTPHDARAVLSGWIRRRGLDVCPLCRFIADSRTRMMAASTGEDIG
jgi:hypothetical protein